MNYGVLAWFEGRYAKVPPTEYTQKKPNQIALADYRIKPPYDQQLSEPGTTSDLGVVRGQLEIAPDFVDSECLTRFTDKAIEWVEGRADTALQGEPFFLYLPLSTISVICRWSFCATLLCCCSTLFRSPGSVARL